MSSPYVGRIRPKSPASFIAYNLDHQNRCLGGGYGHHLGEVPWLAPFRFMDIFDRERFEEGGHFSYVGK